MRWTSSKESLTYLRMKPHGRFWVSHPCQVSTCAASSSAPREWKGVYFTQNNVADDAAEPQRTTQTVFFELYRADPFGIFIRTSESRTKWCWRMFKRCHINGYSQFGLYRYSRYLLRTDSWIIELTCITCKVNFKTKNFLWNHIRWFIVLIDNEAADRSDIQSRIIHIHFFVCCDLFRFVSMVHISIPLSSFNVVSPTLFDYPSAIEFRCFIPGVS